MAQPEATGIVPVISIVLPAYNAESFLEETIKAVFAQTYHDWELVIVDDGSTDRTLVVARSFGHDPRVRVFGFANGGESAARNRGLAQAYGASDFVVFLDHDDVLAPDFLEQLYTALRASPEAAGAYCNGRSIDVNGDPTDEGFIEGWCRSRAEFVGGRLTPLPPGWPTTFATLAYTCGVIPGPCISSMSSCLIRRRSLPAGAPFNESMRTGSADLHLYLRLALSGHFVFVDQPLYAKRSHASNITNNQLAAQMSVLYALRDVALTVPMTQEQRDILAQSHRMRARQSADMHWQFFKGNLLKRYWRGAAAHLWHMARYRKTLARGFS